MRSDSSTSILNKSFFNEILNVSIFIRTFFLVAITIEQNI